MLTNKKGFDSKTLVTEKNNNVFYFELMQSTCLKNLDHSIKTTVS